MHTVMDRDLNERIVESNEFEIGLTSCSDWTLSGSVTVVPVVASGLEVWCYLHNFLSAHAPSNDKTCAASRTALKDYDCQTFDGDQCT